MIERRICVDKFETYTFELQHQTYKVRSSEDETTVTAVFDRLQKELDNVQKAQKSLTQHEELVIAALNITQELLNQKEENELLLELLDAK